jgi:hypothetical protein
VSLTARRSLPDFVWRVAALAVLLGGAGLALWRDPALLDRPGVVLALSGVFAVLWMVPVLRARLAGRRAAAAQAAEQPVRAEGEARDARWLIDLCLGAAAGLLAGALFLSFPGSAHMLTRGPELVDRVFDAGETYGLWAVIGGVLALVLAFRLAQTALAGVVRSGRFGAAFIMALFLWVPFHETFAAGFRLIGFGLPGLPVAETGDGT